MRHKRGSVLGSGAPPVYRNSRDSPLEETVSSEPVSGAQFPVTRVNTGNFVKFEAPQPIKWSKLAVKPEAYRGVPCVV